MEWRKVIKIMEISNLIYNQVISLATKWKGKNEDESWIEFRLWFKYFHFGITGFEKNIHDSKSKNKGILYDPQAHVHCHPCISLVMSIFYKTPPLSEE